MKKEIKIYRIFSMLIIFCISVNYVNAQTKTVDEQHVSIEKHHGEIKKHVTEIHKSKTKQERINHTDSIGTHLAAAHKEHTMLHGNLTPAQQAASKTHNDALAKHHIAAMSHHTKLKEEVSKSSPNEVKIKEHATNVQKETEGAEKEHSEYKKTTITK